MTSYRRHLWQVAPLPAAVYGISANCVSRLHTTQLRVQYVHLQLCYIEQQKSGWCQPLL